MDPELQPPPLLQIAGDFDIRLDVYAHSSARFAPSGQPMNDEYGDTDRLADLGEHAIGLIVTEHLHARKPPLSADEIITQRNKLLEEDAYRHWFDHYNFVQKFRYNPTEVNVHDADVVKTFMHTYIGALYVRNDRNELRDWVCRLVDPGQDPAAFASSYVSGVSISPPPPPTQSYQPQPGYGGAQHFSQSQPPPPASPPPPIPQQDQSFGNSLSLVTLALVNQTAVQRGVSLTYNTNQTGPSHQPIWTAECLVSGVVQGSGVGKTQKIAKEEAAKVAWLAMGWNAW